VADSAMKERGMRRKGTTLVEMLITMFVFTILMVAAFAIMKMGAQANQHVEAKTDVQKALRLFESDILTELRRASESSVGIYTPNNDYHWAIWFKTAMNDGFDVNVSHSLGVSQTMITNNGNPVLQRYVLYYVGLMDPNDHAGQFGNTCTTSYAAVGTGPDTLCPHKWIIKKDLYLTDSPTHDGTGNDTIGTQAQIAANSSNLTRWLTDKKTQQLLVNESTPSTNVVARVRVMAQNIASFELTRMTAFGHGVGSPPTQLSTGEIVLFDVKAFKATEAAQNITVGTVPIVTVTTAGNIVQVTDKVTQGAQLQAFTSSTVTPVFQPYTVQLDNRVIPENP